MAGTISHGQTAHTIYVYISSGFFSCNRASIERGPSLDKTETQFHEALMHVPRHCANVSHPLANCRTCALTRCASYAKGSAGRQVAEEPYREEHCNLFNNSRAAHTKRQCQRDKLELDTVEAEVKPAPPSPLASPDLTTTALT